MTTPQGGFGQVNGQFDAARGFTFGQSSPGFGIGQPQANPFADPFAVGPFGHQPAPAPDAGPTSAPSSGFSLSFGQTAPTTFGQQLPAVAPPPAPTTFGQPSMSPGPAGFGNSQPVHLSAGSASFSFGQQPARPVLPPSSASTGLAFGQPPAGDGRAGHVQAVPTLPQPFNAGGFGTSFGTMVVPASGNAGGGGIGVAGASTTRSFAFGSALRSSATPFQPTRGKETQQQRDKNGPLQMATHQDRGGGGEEEEEQQQFDVEAAKKAALASLPTFAGGPSRAQGEDTTGSKPPRGKSRLPPSALRQGKLKSNTKNSSDAGNDVEEAAKRAQRQVRFLPVRSSAALAASAALDVAAAVTHPNQPTTSIRNNKMPFQAAVDGTMGEENSEAEAEDDDGGHRAGSGAIVGTCEEMCPAVERERRQNMSDIQLFERVDPVNASLTSPELAVKRFARTVDDPRPSEFRTRGALARTMAYLRTLLDRTDVRFGLIHKFLWDRYRSVRQDLYIQGIDDGFAIDIFEEIVRFHVLCEHELSGEDQSVTNMEGFNSHLNLEQMNKALISLTDMYVKAAAAGRPAPNEAEFRVYHLLSLMAQHGKFKGDQQAFLSTLQTLRPEVKGAPLVQWVLQLRAAYVTGNFVRFFILVQEAPYLPACLAHAYFSAVRARALRTLSETLSPGAARPAIVELSWLRCALMLDSNDEVEDLCTMHGFSDFTLDSESGEPAVALVRGAYVDPPPPVAKRPSAAIQAKTKASKSASVTTSTAKPLSPEEAAALAAEAAEAERKRREVAAAARAAAEVGKAQRQEAARRAAAEEEKRRREAELAARLEEEERRRAQAARLHTVRRQEEEAKKAREAAAAAAARRVAEEAAERERQLAAQRAKEEAARHAAEEKQRRKTEAERRRKAAEEAEQRRLEKEKRQEEEQERQRLEALRVRVLQMRYARRWVAETRRRVAERRRQKRIADSLKACRVGVLPSEPTQFREDVGQVAADLESLLLESEPSSYQRAPLDLPAIAAPYLARRSPDASKLFWKIAVVGLTEAQALNEQHRPFPLLRWVQLQLRCGRISGAPFGSAFVDGPVSVVVRRQDGSNHEASLRTCTSLLPPDQSSRGFDTSAGAWAMAGASGAVIAVEGDTSKAALEPLAAVLRHTTAAVRLPVLIVAAREGDASSWLQVWQALVPNSVAHAISLGVAAMDGNSIKRPTDQPKMYGTAARAAFISGLEWLADHAPTQPTLSLAPLEELARDALTAALDPVLSLDSPASWQYYAAYNEAMNAAIDALEAAKTSDEARWRWPPDELCEPALRRWHDVAQLDAAVASLRACKADEDQGFEVAGTGDDDVPFRLHQSLTRCLGESSRRIVVLPLSAHTVFVAALQRLRTKEWHSPPRLVSVQNMQSTKQYKRKWRHSPSTETSKELAEGGLGPPQPRARLATGLLSLKQRLALERTEESAFRVGLASVLDGDTLREKMPEVAAVSDEATELELAQQPCQGALRRLTIELARERKATASLWARVKNVATSLF
jgi:hypothetical protein